MATVMKVHQGKFEIIADYYIAHYDELLGVNLVSNNQYAKGYNLL